MMGLSLVTKPTAEPVTLIEAKAHCRIDTSDDDGLIAGYIVAARSWLESQLGPLMTQTWDITFDYRWPWDGCKFILRLPIRPVQSITSVTYVDENGVTQTLSASLYKAILNTPVAAIEKAYGASWPGVRAQPAAITVRAVCGYGPNPGDIPAHLRQALLMLVGHFYEHRESVVIGQAPSSVPMSVEMLMSPSRDWSF